jgi:hypothetical protein
MGRGGGVMRLCKIQDTTLHYSICLHDEVTYSSPVYPKHIVVHHGSSRTHCTVYTEESQAVTAPEVHVVSLTEIG